MTRTGWGIEVDLHDLSPEILALLTGQRWRAYPPQGTDDWRVVDSGQVPT